MTDYLGQTPDEIKATMETVPIWGIKESQDYYGTKDSPGPIYDIFKKSADFWKDLGRDQEHARIRTTRSTPRSSSRPPADRAGST